MLSFEQKQAIFDSFNCLERKEFKDGRVGYNFKDSRLRKKQIACQLAYTGNGYVYVQYIEEYRKKADARGYLNIKHLNANELKILIEKVIESFS